MVRIDWRHVAPYAYVGGVMRRLGGVACDAGFTTSSLVGVGRGTALDFVRCLEKSIDHGYVPICLHIILEILNPKASI